MNAITLATPVADHTAVVAIAKLLSVTAADIDRHDVPGGDEIALKDAWKRFGAVEDALMSARPMTAAEAVVLISVVQARIDTLNRSVWDEEISAPDLRLCHRALCAAWVVLVRELAPALLPRRVLQMYGINLVGRE